MARDIAYTLILIAMFSSIVTAQQGQSPAAQPTATPVTKKANERPNGKSPIADASETFDKVPIKAMATRCVNIETETGNIDIELFPENST